MWGAYLFADINEDLPALDTLQFENAMLHPWIVFQFLSHFILVIGIDDQHRAVLIDQRSAHQNKTLGNELIDTCGVLVPKWLFSRALCWITVRASPRNC